MPLPEKQHPFSPAVTALVLPPACDSASSESDVILRSLSVANANRTDIFVYGHDSRSKAETDEVKWARRQQPKQSNHTTRRRVIMNLALRGIEADFGPEHADTFCRDLHPELRADYGLANPPFNDSVFARCSTLSIDKTLSKVVREVATHS